MELCTSQSVRDTHTLHKVNTAMGLRAEIFGNPFRNSATQQGVISLHRTNPRMPDRSFQCQFQLGLITSRVALCGGSFICEGVVLAYL